MRTALRTAAAVPGDPRTRDRGGSPRHRAPRAGAAPGPTAGAGAGSGGRPWRRLSGAVLWLATGTALLLVAAISGLLPLQPMRVDSDSMTPTVSPGDLLLVRHGQQPVQRGDVVAVTDPLGEGMLVKRAVAVGGDEVAIEDGVLVVDGAAVCEPAIDPARLDGVWFGPVPVPEGHLFLLSDSRDGTIDSRAFGPVPASSLVGTVAARLWPAPGALPSPSAGC
ncbi:signal peptidase I [Geodermatophilus sp. URMC 60]